MTVIPAPSPCPAPGPDEVHVWQAALDLPQTQIRTLSRYLSGDELVRAGRLHLQRARDRFIAARGLLRLLLGRYQGMAPQRVRFHYSAYGKPCLAEAARPARLTPYFNLSHSRGLALFAMSWDRDIGVDVEHIQPGIVTERIAERFFSPLESRALRALPPGEQVLAFFRCWTRKEAYLKAIGEGLARPLDQFDVSILPGEPAALVNVRWDPQEAGRWSLRELDVAPGYIAAVAVKGHGWNLHCADLAL